ncbi:MAG: NAD(P)-dependent alcohol dehydrogenase [Candidatus Obscuribacterales bacterium]|nr:NAD(P)-dependent alcohol dehydrogenase [Candidatus Obscuribacterales bacterium]
MPVQTTTRAFILRDFGLEHLVTENRALPELGEHGVLLSMKAVSLNFRDLMVAKGLYSRNLKLPLVPLSDGAGEVIEVGSSVSRVKRGDRVTPIFMQRWLSGMLDKDAAKSALGAAIDGVLQNEAVFHEDGLVKIPEHLSFEEAATLPCAAVTAWNALMESGKILPGARVLTLGTGGVSIFALQFAKAAGAEVIITSSSDAKLERAKKLGAVMGINYGQTPDWEKSVLKAFPDGVDHVIELGGAGTLTRSLKAVRLGGHISLIGRLTDGQFDPTLLLMKGARLQGVFVGARDMFERMNAAISAHKLRPVIDQQYSVDEIQEALKAMEAGSHFGKIVLRF